MNSRVEQGVAVLGVVYIPQQELLYVGIPNEGIAFKEQAGKREALRVRCIQDMSAIRVLTSSRDAGGQLAAFIDSLQPHFARVEWLKVGSALKFCQLAEGSGDIYPRFTPCCEWDTAAGQAVLEAAGGSLVDTSLNPLRYNQRESIINPHFYALATKGIDWQTLLLN